MMMENKIQIDKPFEQIQGDKETIFKISKIVIKISNQRRNKQKLIFQSRIKIKANGILSQIKKLNKKMINNKNRLCQMSKNRTHGKKVKLQIKRKTSLNNKEIKEELEVMNKEVIEAIDIITMKETKINNKKINWIQEEEEEEEIEEIEITIRIIMKEQIIKEEILTIEMMEIEETLIMVNEDNSMEKEEEVDIEEEVVLTTEIMMIEEMDLIEETTMEVTIVTLIETTIIITINKEDNEISVEIKTRT